MKQLIRHMLKEQTEGLSKLELFVFNKLRSKKENPYLYPLDTWKFIQSLGFNEEETKELFILYTNNFMDSGEYETLKDVDRSNKLDEDFFYIMFENIFDPDDVSWTHPYEYNEEDGSEGENPNAMLFYLGDYDDMNTIFRWYGKDYWSIKHHHNRDFSPIIELEDLELQNNLMEMFGESWMKPFMEWLNNNFGLKVKHIAI